MGSVTIMCLITEADRLLFTVQLCCMKAQCLVYVYALGRLIYLICYLELTTFVFQYAA